jgi:putative transposase
MNTPKLVRKETSKQHDFQFSAGYYLGGRHVPDALRCDNGPEFIAQQFADWCKGKGIEILYIQPGKPDQNAFIERFNRTYRDGVLDAYLFDSVSDVQQITDDWIKRYNEQRPHDSLGKLPPATYRQHLLAKQENSTLEMST